MGNYVNIARQVLAARPPQDTENDRTSSREPLEAVLKGCVIQLWINGEGFWLVADEQDANRLSEPRGAVYTAAEARHLVTVADPEIVKEIHAWKRATDAVVAGVNPALGRIPQAITPHLVHGRVYPSRILGWAFA